MDIIRTKRAAETIAPAGSLSRIPQPRGVVTGAASPQPVQSPRMPSLERAIRTVPVPGAPPPLSREGAAVGLAFLDMALRQNHIRRLTERLSFVEHGVASRTTEVDVRLSLLDPSQREASHLFQRLSSRSARDPEQEQPSTPTIWVPVTRISRLSVSPIDVVDAAGNKLPRLTQYETSRLLASGLYRLLKGILSSRPESRQSSNVSRLLREEQARWLIQAALLALLTERTRPLGDVEQHEYGNLQTSAVGAPGADDCRDLVLSVLRQYAPQLDSYANLLDVALNDYLLVTALDLTKDDHLLSYDAPVHLREQGRAAGPARVWSRSTSARYRIQYLARIPASLRSYHVVAETEPGVHIEAMSLVTDVDEATAKELATDLRALADRLRRHKSARQTETRLLELELQSALGRLSELLRSRQWDASQAGLEMSDDALQHSRWLANLYLSAEPLVNEPDRMEAPLLTNLTADRLEHAADEVDRQQLGSDFSVENDPASSRAHAYWRRTSPRSSDGEHTSVTCTLTLRDATGVRPGSVIAFAVAVATTIYLVGALLAGSPWPYGRSANGSSNADAVVAVLLLVPGFLYTRLDLPMRHTILGHLRRQSRHLAHLSIASAVGASAVIATDVHGPALGGMLGLTTALPLLAAALVHRRLAKHRDLAPARLSAPRWLLPPAATPVPTDAVFQSTGWHHE
ncbi:hypothetical protein [Micromonospora sp. WMMD812]|uniref:hypothetical protein n=1 Tax=Micromonospora sp. WMMD812 TaxID=3015152 RepID=UPI00248B97AE|nr:hypothetical protein [Micromonospora sp. WMMD812]WBB69260.1 hypothetical protein O7603_07885 [Micromonospora sp. WMMD812]